jgi:large repetitive protein
LKTFTLQKMNIPKVAVLATGLTGAIAVALMGPSTAQAYPTYQSDCSVCHTAASGLATAVPDTTTPAASAPYIVTVTPPVNAAGGDTGFWIANADGTTTGVTGGGPGSSAASYSAAMTAPAAAGTYTYKVWAVHGPAYGTGMANFATYTITVGTTTPPTDTDTSTTPPTDTSTTPPTDTSTTPPTDTGTTTAPVTTAPVAPTDATAIAGNSQALVSWTPAGDGGSAITGYTVTASPGGQTANATTDADSASVTGLSNGTAYTFTVTASNNMGTSLASDASTAITPSAAPLSTTTTTPAATTPAAATRTMPVVAASVAATADPAAVIPVGAPNTGAGGASSSTDAPLVGLGSLALLLAGAGATQIIRRRRQV